MEGDRGDIHSTDAGNHGMTAFRLAFRDQLGQEHLPDSVADTIRAHVNRVLDGETIAIARAELRSVTKADEITLEFCCQIRQIAIQNGLPPSQHLRLIRGYALECRRARFDELGIDGSDVSHVCRSRGPNQAFRRVRSSVYQAGCPASGSPVATVGNSLPAD
jgi:hypothetical protein